MSSSATASATASSGFPIVGLLGIIFVCAKVFGFEPVASWSWVWVLAPFWVGLALFALLVVGLMLVAFIAAMYSK